jgi:four helix bundle protein
MQDRLTDFAVRAMELCESLTRSPVGRHLGEQLFRSATACAANYAEVRGAESKKDFIHKLGLVRKELNESMVWLRIVERQKLMSSDAIGPLCAECDELCRIIAASRKTAIQNAQPVTKRSISDI